MALTLAQPAGAATIGPPTPTLDDWNFGRACATPRCTYANVTLAEGRVRAPVSGTITRWRAQVGQVGAGTGPVPVRLQVLRRTVNEPGVASDEFKALRESTRVQAFETGTVQRFETSIRIRQGDYIGLAALDDDVELFGVDGEPGNEFLLFSPVLALGGPAASMESAHPASRMLFNATIRP